MIARVTLRGLIGMLDNSFRWSTGTCSISDSDNARCLFYIIKSVINRHWCSRYGEYEYEALIESKKKTQSKLNAPHDVTNMQST